MGSPQYPNFANALVQGLQARSLIDQQQDQQRRRSLGPDVQAAMGGDSGALGRVAAADPDYALKIGPILDRLDANKQAVVKRASEFTVQAGMGVMNTDPAMRPQAYAAAMQEATRLGIPTENWPKQWGPQTEGWLQFNLNKAIPVAKWFEENQKDRREAGNQLQPMAVPGPNTAGGVNQFNIGNVRPVGGGPNSGFQQPATWEDGVNLAVNNARAYPGKYNSGQPMTLLQIGERWAPRGDGANDPAQWARNVAAIGGLPVDQPINLDDPAVAAAFARGVHGAEHGQEALRPPQAYMVGGQQPALGTPPAAMPQPRAVAQGADMPADASGTPLPPQPQGDMQSLLGRLPQGVVPLINPKTKMPAYDASGRLAVQFPDGRRDYVEVPKAKKGGEGGPFAGTGMDAQAYNIVLGGDPLTPAYAAAYAHLAAPKVQLDPQSGQAVQIKPDMSWARPPGQTQGSPPQSVTVPATPPGAQGAAPAPGSAGVSVEPVPGLQRKPEAFKKLETEVRGVEAATDRFLAVINEAGGGSFDSYINNPRSPEAQKVLGAFNALKTALRSEAFVNTGVLQPGEMVMLDSMLLSPMTIRGAVASPEAYAAMLGEIRTFVRNKFDGAKTAYGQQQPQAPVSAPKTPVDRERLLFDARKAIEKGAPRDAVLQELKNKHGIEGGL